MASSSNKENIQTTLNLNNQKELGKLFTENKDLQRQVTELNKKIKTLLSSAVKIRQDNNLLKKEINSKLESSEMNRRKAQIEEKFNKIATYTQSKFLKLQSNGDSMEIQWTSRKHKYQSINREGFQDAGFAREESTQSDNVDNSLKDKRQKKQNYEMKQINNTAHNKDKYLEENSTKDRDA